VPWCEECARYLAPSAMGRDGSCPSCGRVPAASDPVSGGTLDLRSLAGGDDADVRAPWHFKLLVFLLVAYLGWRIVDLFI
jgi:hypothetical protein